MRIRRAAPADAEAVADVFLAAKAEMTYLPDLHTDAETRRWIIRLGARCQGQGCLWLTPTAGRGDMPQCHVYLERRVIPPGEVEWEGGLESYVDLGREVFRPRAPDSSAGLADEA
jgi:hypothetical protein